MLRGIVLLLFAVGGVYGGYRLLMLGLEKYQGVTELHFEDGSVFIMIPIGLVGAVVGAMVGGMFLPRRK